MQQHRTKVTARAGFTLVEVMIASTILGLVMLGFHAAFLGALRTQFMAEDHYAATAVARNRLQRALSMDFDSLALLDETATRVDARGTPDANGSLMRHTYVSNVSPDCVYVACTIYFDLRRGGGQSEPIQLTTMRTRNMWAQP